MDGNTSELSGILKQLTADQLKFVAARLNARTDKDAAETIGIPSQTVYNWSNKSAVDEAVKLAQLDTIEVARERLRRLLVTAIDVVEDEMGEDKKRRLDAAKEVFDRAGVAILQVLDITSGGKSIFDLEEWKRNRQDRLTEADEIE